MGDPWKQAQFIERLSFLPDDVPGAPESHRPDGVLPLPLDWPMKYLYFFREHARIYVDPELLEDRENIWLQDFCLEYPHYLPTWVTLKAPGGTRASMSACSSSWPLHSSWVLIMCWMQSASMLDGNVHALRGGP